MTYLVFVRHGQAVGVEGRCIGHTDVELSTEGAHAIRSLASVWARSRSIPQPTRIVSSDLLRATDSARLLAESWALTVESDARLREMHFGEWDGRAWTEIEAADGARLQAWMERWTEAATPGGETAAGLAERARTWLDPFIQSAKSDCTETVAIVSHAGWIRVALCILLNTPMSEMFHVPSDYAHATIVCLESEGARLVALNQGVADDIWSTMV